MTTRSTPPREFKWGHFGPAIIAPTVILSIEQGLVVPMLPVVATNLGASFAAASTVAGAVVFASLLGNLPTGLLIDHLGERRAMMVAAVVSSCGLALAWMAPNVLVLGVGAFIMGLAHATFMIARQALITIIVPPIHRGRAMAGMAGAMRLGQLIGPFVATVAITIGGSTHAVFPYGLALLGVAVVALQWLPDPEEYHLRDLRPGEGPRENLMRTIRENWLVLSRLGPGVMAMQSVRQGRNIIVPLWGVSLGVEPSSIALLVGVAAAVDLGLAYPGGVIADRLGRIWACVPGLLIFAAGWVIVGASGLLGSDGVAWYIAGTLTLGAANGITSGIVATMGGDLVNSQRPATFLAAWQLTSNLGGTVTPAIVSGVTAAVSLAGAAIALGGVGVVGAATLAIFVPRYLPTHGRRRSPAGPEAAD